MGITGLLPFVKKASRRTNIRNFSGSVVAVDGFAWLHKGAYGCAQKLGTGEPTVAYITYFMKYVNILTANGLRPILVFDGRSLPSKEETNRKRREKRVENRIKAKEALRVGNKREAWECFQKSIEITPAMVREVIKELRAHKLDYIIAPYEADAQMAFLANTRIVDLVVTEDSDLVLFGCPKIFFKLNVDGDGVIYDQSRLHTCLEQPAAKFSFDRFRQMCIFSGCDYLESIAGIGLGRAKKIFTMTTHDDIALILKDAPSIVKLDLDITPDYISEFQRAENTFLYQLVFDPIRRQLCPLTPYPTTINKDELSYCGSYETPELSLLLALGNVDIKTLKTVDNFDIDDPKKGYATAKSIWSTNFKNMGKSLNNSSAPQNDIKTKALSNASPKKTVIVSSATILKKSGTKAKENLQKPEQKREEKDEEQEDEESHAKLLLNSFCRSPSPKRPCLRNFYSGKIMAGRDEETLEETKKPEPTVQNQRLRKKVLATPSPVNEQLPTTPGTVTSTDSDDSTFMNLRSRKAPIQNGVIRPPNLEIFSKKNGHVTNGNGYLSTANSSGIDPLDPVALVLIDKIDSGRPTRKCTSRYFTAGKKEFLGNKNHALFTATKGEGKRTRF